jgi:hypothetical protein
MPSATSIGPVSVALAFDQLVDVRAGPPLVGEFERAAHLGIGQRAAKPPGAAKLFMACLMNARRARAWPSSSAFDISDCLVMN